MPALFILIPLAGVIIQNLLSRRHGEKASPWLSGFVCLMLMAMALTSGASAWSGVNETLATQLPFGASLVIDFTGAVVLFTIGLVALLAIVLNGRRDSLNFTNLVMMSVMGMSGTVMVRDLFSLYVFLELTSVASFIMISMRKEKDGFEGAFKYLVLSAVATVMMLAAIALVFLTVGKLDFGSLRQFMASPAGGWPLAMKAALVLLAAGFMIKAGVVPFHSWVPGAYSSAPPAVSVMLAGIVTKAGGVYVILRMMKDVFGSEGLGLPFMILGAVSIVVGALAAIGQKDMKRMLAWSSVSQVGYIILGAGLGTPLALAGALLHFFNHAVFKSLLFVNAATVEEQAGTRDMDKLGGLANNMKITGGTSVVGFLSTAGVPPLSGFWSKLFIIMALWQAGHVAYATVALLASVITLGYFLILQHKVFFGKIREGLEDIREGKANYTVPALVLASITVVVGIALPFALNWLMSLGLF